MSKTLDIKNIAITLGLVANLSSSLISPKPLTAGEIINCDNEVKPLVKLAERTEKLRLRF